MYKFHSSEYEDSSEESFRAMSDASPLGVFISDVQGNCTYTNAVYQRITGQALSETLGSGWTRAIHPQDREQTILDWKDVVRTQVPFITEIRFVHKDNSLVWTRINIEVIRDKNDGSKVQGYVQIVEDISDRKAIELLLLSSEDALYQQQDTARVTLDSIGDGVITINLEGEVTYLNSTAEILTGWRLHETKGLALEQVFHVVDATTRKFAHIPIAEAVNENRTTKLASNSVLISRNGSELPIEESISPILNRDKTIIGVVIVFHDVSDTRALTEKMTHLAQHDFLTGLPNRALLTDRLSRALGLASRNKKKVGLLFIDVDNFKQINDSLGHYIGDKLLQSVARRLETLVRNTDTICRQGGDEFVILLTEIEQVEDAAQVTDKLIEAFTVPHKIDEHLLLVTLSIGASIYPDDSEDLDTMFKHADSAMYQAKISGRNNFQFFCADAEAQKKINNTMA